MLAGLEKGRKNVLFNMDPWIAVFPIIMYRVANGKYNTCHSVES